MEVGLVVLWLAVFLLLGFAALPLASWLLPDVDAGAFAIPIALAVLAVVGHLVGYVAFGWPAVIAGLGVLAGLSILVADRTDTELDFRRAGEHALVFTAGFLLVVVIRGIDPTAAPLPLAVGEKFLDIGLLNALDRTGTLPPEDMWFAGEAVRYHYGGHMLSALLGTLTGTGPAFAYNLALAGFFGTLLTAAYGLAGSIAQPAQGSRRLAGALGVFFVGIAGNLETFGRLLAWQLPRESARWLVTRLGFAESIFEWTPGDFYYFDATRVIPVRPDESGSFEAATEFPFFAWLHGDLHAHVMSQPFVLLLAAVLLAYWRAPAEHRRLLLCGAVPPLVGLVGFVNIWSLPVVLGLTALGVLFAPGDPAELLPDSLGRTDRFGERDQPIEEARRLVFALAGTAIAFVGGILWTLPFWLTSVLGGPSNQSVEYWGQWTPLGPLLVVLGAFILAIAAYFGRQFATERVRPPLVVAAGVAALAVTALLGVPAFGLTLPLILGGWYLLRTSDAGYETMLVVAGAGLLLLIEFVTIEGERFNVIFKPHVEIWLFWAIGTAAILPRLVAGRPTVEDIDRTWLRRSGIALTAVLVLVTAPYAVFAMHGHVTDGTETTDEVGMTLDATAYLDVHYPEEAGAIRWLDAQSGQSTIVTAPPANGYATYFWVYNHNRYSNLPMAEGGSAPSSLTGIPTVAGWEHEAQYRGEAVYAERKADAETIFTGEADEQTQLLAKYDVSYVYVGPVEDSRYTITVDRLDAVSVAESWPDVTIYEVDQEQLASASEGE